MTGVETVPILGHSLVEWLSLYGYWILFPLLVIEGPVVGFTAGILISYGVFNPVLVFIIYVLGTTVSDTVLYFLARNSVPVLNRFSYSRRIISAIREDQENPERGWTDILEEHFVRFFIFAKVTPTVAISEALAIAAGILRISPRKVYMGIIVGQPIWSAAILALGFYFGNTIQDFSFVFNVTGIIMTVLVVSLVLYFVFYDQVIKGTAFGDMLDAWKNRNNSSVHNSL